MSDSRLHRIRRLHSADLPWRSLAEREQARRGEVTAEFPPGAAGPLTVGRRDFVRVLGSGLAAAGAGCAREEPRKILPYTNRPPEVTPGLPSFYATSMVMDGYATGLVVQAREGRPIKIEGNPEHPASLGATSLQQQAAIYQLYDDFRARRVRRGATVSSWEDLFEALRAPRADAGAGLRILMEPTSSPLILDLLARLRRRLGAARVTYHAAVDGENARLGAIMALGRPLLPQYDLSAPDVILSLDADFLDSGPFALRYARQWATRRRLDTPSGEMNRLYLVESLLTTTGSMADHRLRRPASRVGQVARAIAARLPALARVRAGARPPSDQDADWVDAVARDLRRGPPGSTVVLVGDRQPLEIHALGHALNAALGNLGRSAWFTEPVLAEEGPGTQTLPELVADMRAGRVDTLVILDGNPAYTAPADLDFAGALRRVRHSFCFAYYENETAAACRWFGPIPHFLESWGDARAHDGTVSLIQPLVRPLADARGAAEILAVLAGEARVDAERLLRDLWVTQRGLDEAAWLRAVQVGMVPGTALPQVAAPVRIDQVANALASAEAPGPTVGIELELRPSPTIHDGRFANNAWLQEQPAPITKLTWDNAALLSPATARALQVENEALVSIAAGGASALLPVLVVPGQADGVVGLWLGYGQKAPREAWVMQAGVNVYPFRTLAAPHIVAGARVARQPGRYPLALTQVHWSMEGRPIALRIGREEYRRNPGFTRDLKGPVTSLLPEYEYTGHQWAMTIDTSICTGCSACMMACQTENNLLVVGKENVLRSREMHWLRIDTYFTGPPEDPAPIHQPMLCQHCEKAPCEYVCPVNATVHSPDGLNEMVYNRCVGTRFCSNNCPYKVRRFNYFDYTERVSPNRGLVQLKYNPEVTVRERGVMEKCTYCVQRIRSARIAARLEGRDLRPGEVVTACQSACPTGAIQFGSLAHRDTPMVRWREEPRSYAVLHDQGTQPRTLYLARVDNPNPELRRR